MRDLTTQLRRQRKIQGFVYTELTDIEWEHNGLVNYDRSAKRFGYDTWLPDMRPNELLGPDFIGYDAPPAIVGKPGQTITVPVFVSHYSDRQGPVNLRWWVSGYDHRGDMPSVVLPTNVPITWRPYDVVDLEPLKNHICRTIRSWAAPFVDTARSREPAVRGQLRQPRGQAGSAHAANRAARAQRRSRPFRAGRIRQPGMVRTGKGRRAEVERHTATAAGYFEYRIKLPATVIKAHPESIYYLFEAGSKARRDRVDWPQRVNRRDYPQTDSNRTWPSKLTVSLYGRLIDRIDLVDDAADARGVLAHLAGVEHGSHGELVDGKIELNDLDRARLTAGEPLVLRLAVPTNSSHAGGICIFGASTGQMPLDPTLQVHTRDPLPTDLGVDRQSPAAVPANP